MARTSGFRGISVNFAWNVHRVYSGWTRRLANSCLVMVTVIYQTANTGSDHDNECEFNDSLYEHGCTICRAPFGKLGLCRKKNLLKENGILEKYLVGTIERSDMNFKISSCNITE